MSSKEFYFDQIASELATARGAMERGNEGMVRVCARRAVGQALTWFRTMHPRSWPADAMMQIRSLSEDPSFPQEVRDAAVRLTTRITERFTYPFSTDPLADAQIIIDAVERMMDSPNV